MSRSAEFLLIAAISAVVFLGCKKERSFCGANPGDEIVFGGTAGSASGFSSSKTKGGDGDSSVAGTFAVKGLDSCRMNTCSSYARDDSDADETYYFDWEDFEGSEGFGGSDANALFGAEDSDVQTKTDYSGHKENVGGKTYERIDWVVGDKIKIYANGVKPPKTECIYEVSHVTASGIRSSAGLRPFNQVDGHGLMWDSGNADFYAFYPGNSPAKVFASNTSSNFDVTVKLPKEQNIFTKTTSGNHTEVKPDMELAAMMAVSRNVSTTSPVQLDFLPLVTAFRITMSNSLPNYDMKINKISLVYSPSAPTPVFPMSGDYAVKYDKTSGSTLSSHSSGGLQPVNTSSITSPAHEISVDLGTDAVTLTKNNGNSFSVTLFAIPVMHKGLQLKINVTHGGNTEERILDLKQKSPGDWLQFEPYKKYDIKIGIRNRKEAFFYFTTYFYIPYTGETLSDGLRSYETDGVETRPLPWYVDGYSETGKIGPFISTPPTWLTFFPSNGNGGTIPETVSASVFAQPTITHDARTTALRGKSEVGNQIDPIDLSRVPVGNSPFFSIADGATASTYASKPMNTANCYVVTRPGWYKIPVVYGNAFKNGNDNTAAYKPSGSGKNFLQNFLRHDGNAITNPWIKENIGINLNSGVAELLWQDQPNLVQNIQLLQPDKKYIVFHVSQSTIHEGNAVIALKAASDGDIVWSWHIWVYGGDDLKAIKVKNNKGKSGGRLGQDNFNFLSENLGACYDGELKIYPERKVWVKLSNGRKIKFTEIIRFGSKLASGYNSPYYQWGRKDPMLPSDGTTLFSNNNKVWYDKDGSMQSSFFPTATWSSDGTADGANGEIANTIKHPYTFNKSRRMDYLYYNLWDTNCNETSSTSITTARFEPVKKSVYDPCPPGFCLPPNGAFTGFTKIGAYGVGSEKNTYGLFSYGWHFRTVLLGEPDAAIDPTIFFHASGYRSNNGNIQGNFGSAGSYWSSVPSSVSYGCSLNFAVGSVFPMSSYDNSAGFVLRPVKE